MRTITNKWTGKVIYQYEPSRASKPLKRLIKYLNEIDEENERLCGEIKGMAFEIAKEKQ